MKPITIGLIGAGEMGAGLARAFIATGNTVICDLAGRSAESRARAEEAGIRPATLAEVAAADIVFSVLPTQCAKAEAARIAEIARPAGLSPAYVEANAIAPALAQEIAALFDGTAVPFIDAGLVGPPPGEDTRPRLYACGADLSLLHRLDGSGFDLVAMEGPPGAASAFKMTYAAMTKGSNALLTAVMLAAEAHGFLDLFIAEAEASQRQLTERARAAIPRLPCDAARWEDEMRQIARTFAEIGLPPDFHQGAEAVMRRLAASPYGTETRRTRDTARSMEATVRGVLAGGGEKTSGPR